MNSAAERTRSLWWATTALDRYAPLARDADADLAVVGAGIAGLSVAYELAAAGQRVIVLDAGRVGGGMTGRTTAHLANALDDRWCDLIALRGETDAQLAAASHTAAIARIEAIQREAAIACDFKRVDGYLFLAPGQEPWVLDDELAAAHQVGLAGVERLERAPAAGFDSGPCLRFPDQGRCHPLKYLAGLARAVIGRGGAIYGDTRVVGVSSTRDGAELRLESGVTVTAKAAMVATNTPVNDLVATHTKQAPYRTYVIAAAVPRGAVGDALYWDTLDPYHYVRLQEGEAGQDFLIVGGEDHKTGQSDDGAARLQRLEGWMRQRFPAAGAVLHRWSGQVMEPIDDLAFIGRNPGDQHVFIATADSGMGTTHGAIAGMLVRDLVLGRDNPWARLYDPARATTKAAGEFAKENLNVVAQFRDYVTPGGIASVDDLAPGEGAILRRGLRKVAAYRDPQGVVHEHSAVCTHMGCLVRWNSLEACFDCPCHGSHFDARDGGVLNGPAVTPLASIDKGEMAGAT
jgi:glycine/D-amino acid oxidase-like deaminating enzyme/nitrite reductase/ring-hydroxylating ferredoxin subunit